MLRNFLTTTFRFLLKNKTGSVINILGLSAGTLCCLYILLYVRAEYSYDKHQVDVKDIYRVDQYVMSQGNRHNTAMTATPLAPAMKKDFPEVEQFTRIVPFIGVDKQLVSYGVKHVWEKNIFIVDSSFFDVFTYRQKEGNLKTALVNPYTVVLLKPFADKLFGNIDPLGKTIAIDNTWGKHDYQVTGVAESLGKSHVEPNIFITTNVDRMGQYFRNNDSWISNAFWGTYIKLHPDADPKALQKKLPAFMDKYAGKVFKEWNLSADLYLQPIGSIHTTAGFENPGIGNPVNSTFLRILVLIAVLIQLMACINFMNLSTARASRRAKEVGVRKVIGAARGSLVKQFLAESILLSVLAILIAVPLLLILMPWLNRITGSEVDPVILSNYRIWVMLVVMALVTGLVAGSYPAFYLSAFKAVRVIKGNFTNHISAAGIRRFLVVFQFVLSISLVIGIIVIYAQLSYIRNKDLGFDSEQRLVFTFNSDDAIGGIPAFMGDLSRLAEVKEVSNASHYLSSFSLYNNSFMLPGQNTVDQRNANYIIADAEFVKANGIHIISGRDFRAEDSDRVLINETYARALGINPEKVLGTRLHDSQNREVEVIGVMKDFHFWSLHRPVESFLLWKTKKQYGLWPNVILHTSTRNYQALLSKIARIWKKDVPGMPFEYLFLDEQVQKQYESDLIMSRIINSFTLIAVLIAGLGIFGLAAFSAEKRSKEIAIRVVLGSSVPAIVRLLSADFIKLVLIASLIAAPLSWLAMNQWLQAFAYRAQIRWWMFLLAGGITILVAILTASSQAIKAAVANPVKSLRAE